MIRAVIGVVLSVLVLCHAARQFLSRGPRPRLRADDWTPRGWLGFLAILCAGLLYSGVWVLVTPRQTFRVGGALALAGGMTLLGVMIQYVRRPVRPEQRHIARSSDAVLPPFPLRARGYDQAQVDEFFSGIWRKSAEEIHATRFTVRFRGYSLPDVDRSLDGWTTRQQMPGDEPPRYPSPVEHE